jgi:hypothetical protein
MQNFEDRRDPNRPRDITQRKVKANKTKYEHDIPKIQTPKVNIDFSALLNNKAVFIGVLIFVLFILINIVGSSITASTYNDNEIHRSAQVQPIF